MLVALLPVVLLLGLSGPSTGPSLAAPTPGLDATPALPALTCGALGIPSSMLRSCSTTNLSNGAAVDAADVTSANCNLYEQLLGLCEPPPNVLLLELAYLYWLSALGSPPTTTTTSGSTTTSSSTSTTTSSSTSTTTTTTTTPPPTSCAGSAPPVAAPSGTWSCSFDDEFNGTQLDTSKWQVQLTSNSGFTTGSMPYEVCYVNNPQTVSESGGYLNLSIIDSGMGQSCPGLNGLNLGTQIWGGSVDSMNLFSQKYGFFEASAEMPASSTPGLQDTLWLYPSNETLYGPWPNSGEIDYGQWYSEYPNNDYPDNIYPGDSGDPNALSTGCSIAGQSPAGQFHTYAVLWTPTTLTEYYDGKVCQSDTYGSHVTYPDTAPEPFTQPFFLALTAALGSVPGDQYQPGQTPLPATLKVDWVRAWQYGG